MTPRPMRPQSRADRGPSSAHPALSSHVPGPPPARPQPWSASGPRALQERAPPSPLPPEPDLSHGQMMAQGERAVACEHLEGLQGPALLHPRRTFLLRRRLLSPPPGCQPPSAPRSGSGEAEGGRPVGGFVTDWQQAGTAEHPRSKLAVIAGEIKNKQGEGMRFSINIMFFKVCPGVIEAV